MQCTVYGAGSLVALFHSLYTEHAFNSVKAIVSEVLRTENMMCSRRTAFSPHICQLTSQLLVLQ